MQFSESATPAQCFDSTDSLLDELGLGNVGQEAAAPATISAVVSQPLSNGVSAGASHIISGYSEAYTGSGLRQQQVDGQSVFGPGSGDPLLHDGGDGLASGLPRSGSWCNMDDMISSSDMDALPSMLGSSDQDTSAVSLLVNEGQAGLPQNFSMGDLTFNDS